MFGIIYITVNKIDGRKYIGQHKCNRLNDSYLGSGKVLKQAIEKYGRENFERHVLYVAKTEEELDQKEIEFISAFRATERPEYYNINEGGNANRMCGKNNPMYGLRGKDSPAYGRKKTEEEREKLRVRMSGENNSMYGHVYTEEERKKIGDGQRGEKHWNYGKHWSDEVKKKISNTKLKKRKESHKKYKPRTPEHCRHISEAKKGKSANFTPEDRQHRAELITERNHTEKFRNQVSEANREYHKKGGRRGAKPVVCVETNIVYASCYDASRSIGCGLSSISSCISGSCKTVKGYHWRFATEEECSGELVYAE